MLSGEFSVGKELKMAWDFRSLYLSISLESPGDLKPVLSGLGNTNVELFGLEKAIQLY